MAFEGGFQGRTNKLVDGCYSFWVGALLPLIQAVQRQQPIRDSKGYSNQFFQFQSRNLFHVF